MYGRSELPSRQHEWFEAAAYANALSEAEKRPACYTLSGCTGVMGQGMPCTSVATTASGLYECPGYRLPTAVEWEYAARAGTKTAFYSGNITRQAVLGNCYADPALEGIAWYCNNAQGKTHHVGLKRRTRSACSTPPATPTNG